MLPVRQSPLVFEEADVRVEDLLAAAASKSSTYTQIGKKRQRKANVSIQENKMNIQDVNDSDNNHESKLDKKAMHRENKRRRRQEMANLCASLRALIPPELIKGKRATSDHMQEAAGYIEKLQSDLRELQLRRDEIKKKSNSSKSRVEDGRYSSCNNTPTSVVINPCDGDGNLEILITTSRSNKEKEFPLSTLLVQLLERGFNVVSCGSTKASETSIHAIQAKVGNPTSIDLPMLQERLTNIVSRLA